MSSYEFQLGQSHQRSPILEPICPYPEGSVQYSEYVKGFCTGITLTGNAMKESHHKITRESDENVCSCGLRWGVDEENPHNPVEEDVIKDQDELFLNKDEACETYVSKMSEGQKMAASVVISVDLASGVDRTVVNGHVLYKPSDFGHKKLDPSSRLADMVCEGGLHTCMNCGEYESGLDTWCGVNVPE